MRKSVGMKLLDGSLYELKDSQQTVKVEFDWSECTMLGESSENDKNSERSEDTDLLKTHIDQFESKFIVYYNANHTKKTGVTFDESAENADKILKIIPTSLALNKMKVLGSTTSMVIVGGVVILQNTDDERIATLNWLYMATTKGVFAKGNGSESAINKLYRIDAEQLANDLAKQIKKAKAPKNK